MSSEQLQAAIDSILLQVAEGVQQIRYPDGSGLTFVDAAQAPERLRMLRAELAVVGGVRTRTRIVMYPTAMRRFP